MTDSQEAKNLRLLIDLLKSEAACLRGAGAFGLSLLGPDAKQAIPALADALPVEGETEVARAMVFALGDIGVEAAPALASALKHPIEEIREDAQEGLCSLALTYRESGREVPELTAAFAEIPELESLMTPLGESLGLPPRSPGELTNLLAGEQDTFRTVSLKRELGNALQGTKQGKRGPH
jgi:hypothetical protein